MADRAHWGSRLGFVLAAAGSAVGLGNVWKFPYVTGENGGGLFVLVYLVCIATVGVPVLMAEVLVGRAAQRSPVGAFRALVRPGSPWVLVGWLGVLAALVILSYYSVVAGWCLDYLWRSASGGLSAVPVGDVPGLFGELVSDPGRNLGWHALFMIATVAIVVGGVRGGVERASRLLMPALFVIFLALLAWATTLSGFGEGARFVFGLHADQLKPAGVLEALGHAFFTLSVGMGAMLTYGSYLAPKDDLPGSVIATAVLDTVVSLVACLVLFPILFTFQLPAASGAGLVFKGLPLAFAQLPFGGLWATLFFVLLTFAALTSAISLLEVTTATLIDERGWDRRRATLAMGAATFVLGIPSALSGGKGVFGDGLSAATGRSWFDWFDHVASSWLLPLTGLGIALFVAWRFGADARREAFVAGSRLGAAWFFVGWLLLLRWIVPVAIGAVFLHAVGVF